MSRPQPSQPRTERPSPRWEGAARPQPQPRYEAPRYESPQQRPQPRYEAPSERTQPRYEAPREQPRYESAAPRASVERPAMRESRSASQNGDRDDDR
jgi:hypothetical protein